MKKIYMIGERDGKKYVAHATRLVLDGAQEITKAEYRRYREAGIPSWGEHETDSKMNEAQDYKRALHWVDRRCKAREKDEKARSDWARKCAAERVRRAQQERQALAAQS